MKRKPPTYLRKGQLCIEFDKAVHNYERMIADGWIQYDPQAPGDSSCTDTHRKGNTCVCIHGYSWWCPRAPRHMWYPDALHAKDRAWVD